MNVAVLMLHRIVPMFMLMFRSVDILTFETSAAKLSYVLSRSPIRKPRWRQSKPETIILNYSCVAAGQERSGVVRSNSGWI